MFLCKEKFGNKNKQRDPNYCFYYETSRPIVMKNKTNNLARN